MRNLRIVVTDSCNLSCAYCYNEGNEKCKQPCNRIDLSKLKQAVYFLAEHFNDVIITGGEPMMYSDITGLLDVFASVNKYPRITTNGILLDRLFQTEIYKKLSRFNISIDRFEATSFRLRSATNPQDYARLISNIQTLVSDGKEVTLNMICDEYTSEKELEDILENIRALGVKRVKFIPLIGGNEQTVIDSIVRFLTKRYGNNYASHKTDLDIDEYRLNDLLVMIVHQYCNMNNCDYCRKNTFYRLNFDGKIYRCLRDKADYFDLFKKIGDNTLEKEYLAFDVLE